MGWRWRERRDQDILLSWGGGGGREETRIYCCGRVGGVVSVWAEQDSTMYNGALGNTLKTRE